MFELNNCKKIPSNINTNYLNYSWNFLILNVGSIFKIFFKKKTGFLGKTDDHPNSVIFTKPIKKIAGPGVDSKILYS